MNRKQHNIRGVQYGIEKIVADCVNKDKDAPSQKYPICSPHGFNHGIGTNMKYFRIGRGGMAMSILHNIDDRITRRCRKPKIVERARSWHPSKMIGNVTQLGNWWNNGVI